MNRDNNMVAEIARVAYGLYEKRGHVAGHDLADWIEAEKIVMKGSSPGNVVNEKAAKSTRPARTPDKSKSKVARQTL